MSNQKIATIITALYDKTLDGQLKWEQTAEDGVYQISFNTYAIKISETLSPSSDDTDINIAIYDWKGRVVEVVTDPMMRLYLDEPFKKMKELYDTARRQAMGVEDALDSILNILAS